MAAIKRWIRSRPIMASCPSCPERGCSDRHGLAIRRHPPPGAGAVAALEHALLVDLADDLAVACEQRFGRAHFGAERQLPRRQAIGAVLGELGGGAVRFRPAGTIRALVHLAAGAEIADLR